MDPASITLDQLSSSHHELIDSLRHGGPVTWVPAIGAWMVTGRDLAIEVLRDGHRFTVDDPRFSTARVVGPSMLSLDGDEHRRHRAPFVAAFRPSTVVANYGPQIEAHALTLVEGIAPTGRADLTTALARPLAAFASMVAIGLESAGADALLTWYRWIVAATEQRSLGIEGDDDGGEAAQAMTALRAAVAAAADDPATTLFAMRGALSGEEIASNAAVFLFGGIETTEAMIANLLFHLLSHPAQLDAVRRDRALADAAIEESLRLEPAVARVDRYATADVELAGCRIAAGDFVVVSLSGANRDPAVYQRPHEFDLSRTGAPAHLAFVQGPHACIGAHLARLEARAALDAVLDTLPSIRLDEDRAPVAVDGIVFRKARELPVRWDVAPSGEFLIIGNQRRRVGDRTRMRERHRKPHGRFGSALAVAAVALALGACGDDESAAPDTNSETASAASAGIGVTDAWSRQPAEGQTVTAVYGIVSNPTDEDVTIVSASSPVTGRVELHETIENADGTMKMQERDGGFVVPAGGEFAFESGGPHVMLFDIDPATYPANIDVTLTFDAGDPIVFTADVRELADDGMEMDSHMSGDMGGDMSSDTSTEPTDE